MSESSCLPRYVLFTHLAVCWATIEPALATTATVVRPGIMCVSAGALAILTLPNGDSRTHRANLNQRDHQTATEGDCTDLLATMRFVVYRTYHNTSLVAVDHDSGEKSSVYWIPNIDITFSRARSDTPIAALVNQLSEGVRGLVVMQRFQLDGGLGTIELLQDARISPSVFTELWRAGESSQMLAAQHPVFRRPLLTAHLRLVVNGDSKTQTRDVGYPLASLSPLDDSGKAYVLRFDKTDKLIGRIAEERLYPAAHGLTPSD